MKTLHLLRHAKSAWDDPALEDHDRPLNPRGQRAAATMAQHLAARKDGPPPLDLILCSSALRAQETLRAILTAWGPAPPPVVIERALYLCGAATLLRRLRALEEETSAVLVVAHNPDLQELALSLASTGDPKDLYRLNDGLPTGALLTITLDVPDWPSLSWHKGHLVEYVTPRSLQGAEEDGDAG